MERSVLICFYVGKTCLVIHEIGTSISLGLVSENMLEGVIYFTKENFQEK